MTEPKPREGYFTNTTATPANEEELDALDELFNMTMPRISGKPVPMITLTERVDALEALALDLFERMQKLEAEQDGD